MNFWNKLQKQILSFKQLGETVDLSQMGVVEGGRVNGQCALCYEPTDEEIESGLLYTFKENDLCLKHLTEMQS